MSIHRVRISLSGCWEPSYVEGLAVVRGGFHEGHWFNALGVELYTREPLEFRNVTDETQKVHYFSAIEVMEDGFKGWTRYLPVREIVAGGVVEVETLSWCG